MTLPRPRGRPRTTLSLAILAGCDVRPLQARGDYLDADGGASALMAAAEATAKTLANPARPAEILQELARYPILKAVVRCPDVKCRTQGTVERLIEIHLNDRHGWSREEVAAWLVEVERAHELVLKKNPYVWKSDETRDARHWNAARNAVTERPAGGGIQVDRGHLKKKPKEES